MSVTNFKTLLKSEVSWHYFPLRSLTISIWSGSLEKVVIIVVSILTFFYRPLLSSLITPFYVLVVVVVHLDNQFCFENIHISENMKPGFVAKVGSHLAQTFLFFGVCLGEGVQGKR